MNEGTAQESGLSWSFESTLLANNTEHDSRRLDMFRGLSEVLESQHPLIYHHFIV